MKRIRPSPALVISLIALFVALGGTSYAAITSLPANSVGTKQLKNGAVTAAKINAGSSLKDYLKYGGTLPVRQDRGRRVGLRELRGCETAAAQTRFMARRSRFPVPLASAIDHRHTIDVNGSSRSIVLRRRPRGSRLSRACTKDIERRRVHDSDINELHRLQPGSRRALHANGVGALLVVTISLVRAPEPTTTGLVSSYGSVRPVTAAVAD